MDAPAVVLSAVAGVLVGWFALVPIVERIPDPSPLGRRAQIAVALVNGVLWMAVAHKREFDRWWIDIVYFAVFSVLLAVSVVDLRVYRIPDRIVFPALGGTAALIVIATVALQPADGVLVPLKYAVIGMVTYFGILFVFHVVYPAGMGFGDVKLALLMGMAMGWIAATAGGAAYFVMVALFVGCVAGIVFGLAVRVVRKQGGAFPFGPALALGTIYVILNFQNYLV